MAELYSCPELSLSRVQIHSIRSTSHSFMLLLDSIKPRLSVAIIRGYLIRLRISNSRLSHFRFSHSFFLALGFSISLSLISLFPLALVPFFSFSPPIDFSSAKRVPTFHFVPENIHSYPQPFVHHTWNKCILAYGKHTYIYVRGYTYTYTYMYTYVRPNIRIHTYIYTKYTYIIYCSHSHGLSSPL